MRFFKTLGVLLLLAVPCLLLAWGAMAIGQTAALDAGTNAPPASSGISVSTPQQADRSAVQLELGLGPLGTGRAVSVSLIAADPLKDVSDLAKVTVGLLQNGDQYLESQTRALVEEYAQAKDDEARAKLKGELAKTIERHFDVRHEIRKREIDQLEAQVKKLREHLAKRGEARQTIVQMRVGQFISAAEGLGWDADFGGGRSSSFGGVRPSSAVPASDALLRKLYDTNESNLEEVLRHAPAAQAQESSSRNVPAAEAAEEDAIKPVLPPAQRR